MGQSVKKILIFTLMSMLLCVIALSIYVYITISGAKDKISESLLIQTSLNAESSSSIRLDAFSSFKKSDFISYGLFSKNLRDSTELFNSYLEDGLIQKSDNNLYFTNKEIELTPLQKNHCELAYCYQHKIKFSRIPSKFWKGLMGVEDYRFLNHIGIDLISIVRAIITDIKAMKLVQGGSTLTQQLVKNLYFTNEKTFTRKIKEIIIAIYLETKYEKEDILESYFNEVFWGSYKGIRIKGIYAASLIYFGKKPRQISYFEAAILIGMLKGPNYYSPLKHIDRIKKRSRVIFSKLKEAGLSSSKNDSGWSDIDFINWKKKLDQKDRKLYLDTLWRISKVDNSSGFSDYEKFIIVLNAKKVEMKLKKKYPKKDISTKILIKNISRPSSEFRFYSKYERKLDVAINKEKHQVGSTLKPIIYHIFKNFDRELTDLVSTKKINLKLKSGNWSPRESHLVKEDEVTLISALLQSLNRPVVRLAQEIGFDEIQDELVKFIPELKIPLSEYPSQLLGAVELSLEDLWSSYESFIAESCNKVISDNENSELFEDSIISKLSNPKITTIRKIVSKHLKEMRFFGKTGTSNNGFDNWYVFFDGKDLGIIWTGVEGSRDSQKLRIYGSTTSFLIYQNYLIGRGKQINELNCDLFE